MNKKLIVAIIFIIIIVSVVFFPRSVSNAVVIKNGKTTLMYIDGNKKSFKLKLTLPENSVIGFNYNLLFTYNLKKQIPMIDRFMKKTPYGYDLESLGNIPASKTIKYYKIDKNNKISKGNSSDLIIGINNLQSYKDSSGNLDTLLISPLSYDKMRVGITTTNNASFYHQSIRIKCTTATRLYSIIDKLDINLPKDTDITFELGNNKTKVSFNGSSKYYTNRLYLKGDKLLVESIARGVPAFIPSYDGILEITCTDSGLQLINELPLEDYLYKVVPSEMLSNSGAEALKCQAIAARTYALFDMLSNRYSDYGFYVDDSTRSQVYNNIEAKYSTTEAVNSTKSLVITYKDAPIDAKYYSTSSGMGSPYKDAFFYPDGTSDSRPYLIGNSSLIPSSLTLPKTEAQWLDFYKSTSINAIDKPSPYFRWTIDFSEAALTKSLNKSLKELYLASSKYMKITKDGKKLITFPDNLKTLQDIKVIKRGKYGNAIEVSFVFSNASINVSEDYNIRTVIRSDKAYTEDSTIAIKSYGGKSFSNNGFLPSSFISFEKNSNGYKVYGGGSGHGVGLSQYGAISLSALGLKYEDILKTYFKDVTIKKLQ
ncbi:MAG TPA: SpoIID/LytB domain-containing protein [Clostridiaceae bacterium]